MKEFWFFLSFGILILFQPASFAASTAEKPVHLQILFPASEYEASWSKVTTYEKGTIGTEPFLGGSRFSLKGEVWIENVSSQNLGSLRIEVETGPLLHFLNLRQTGNLKDFRPTQKIFYLEKLAAQGSAHFLFKIEKPKFSELKKNEEISFLKARVFSETRELLSEELLYPVQVKRSGWWVGPLGLFTLFFIVAASFFTFAFKKQLFKGFETSELVTLSVFTAFYVLGAFLSGFVKAVNLNSVLMQIVWAIYSWILILTLVRLVPKPGSVSILMILGSLLTGILIFGVDPLMLLTYTIPGALTLELWFAVSGYGRSFFSAFGAAVCYIFFPVAFFWFFVTSQIYHYFYSLPYILFWVGLNAFSYLIASILGYRVSRYFEKVIH